MKKMSFIAALMVGGAAVAQDTQTTTTTTTDHSAHSAQQPSGETVSDPSQSTGPQGITQQGTDPEGQATAPTGTNQDMQTQGQTGTGTQGDTGMGAQGQTGMGGQTGTGGQTGMGGQTGSAAFTPRPATTEYPPCSRTVTDGCIQTYERGVRRRPRG